jgi:hypothetical protein
MLSLNYKQQRMIFWRFATTAVLAAQYESFFFLALQTMICGYSVQQTFVSIVRWNIGWLHSIEPTIVNLFRFSFRRDLLGDIGSIKCWILRSDTRLHQSHYRDRGISVLRNEHDGITS